MDEEERGEEAGREEAATTYGTCAPRRGQCCVSGERERKRWLLCRVRNGVRG